MSAPDPLKRAHNRSRLRTIEPPAEGEAPHRRRRRTGFKSTFRPADANFFCWKYGVWYNLMDCCYRHDHRTYEGCAPCGQGEGNLRANADLYRRMRHLGDPPRLVR